MGQGGEVERALLRHARPLDSTRPHSPQSARASAVLVKVANHRAVPWKSVNL
jgi:hypothetical protein